MRGPRENTVLALNLAKEAELNVYTSGQQHHKVPYKKQLEQIL